MVPRQRALSSFKILSSSFLYLALRSLDLEYISIPYMTDAYQFPRPCPVLTIDLMPMALRGDISGSLCGATLAALNMPHLGSMVLWYCKNEEAGAAIYNGNRLRTQATLTWRGT